MGMISEFKEFALKGSLVDMAVGIVMGGAISTLVGSLLTNLINPIIGVFAGGKSFSDLVIKIGESKAADGTSAPLNLEIGAFITAFVNFLILALVIFIIVKAVNNAKKALSPDKPEAPAGPSQTDLLIEIRDALQR